MSDLLTIGSSGVSAYRSALAAIGENVANAETPGYARRQVRLTQSTNAGSESPIYREALLFSGVEANSVERAWDAFRAADARYSAAAASRAETRERWLTAVETSLADGPSGVGSLLGGFFNEAVSLAATPDERLGRSAMLMALEQAAGAIRTTAESLARVSEGITKSAYLDVEALNDDLEALTKVNTALRQASTGGTAKAAIEDERDRLIDAIAERIDVTAAIADDGTAALTLARATGVALIDPVSRALVTLTPAADGRLSLELRANGTTVPLPATGGSLSALVDVASSTADKRRELDGIAADFAADLNAWSAQGIDENGNPGTDLLVITTGALSLRVLTSDPADIAAASADGTPNGNLLALNALRAEGGAESRWAALVAAQSQALAAARSETAAASTRRDNSFASRDEITGIDLDHEAAELLRFQQAYNGAAKIIQIARETMQAIFDIL
ncbi:flagellar hook-associated protein FlgK [Allosphingosinicella sp.]|uniref:flagellar hook-associated protein FlgK n=1 Tax=Allosphingosinicella sp. TaxID=2823234 RepID=UPI002FC1CC6E